MTTHKQTIIVIPAYQPQAALVTLVQQLRAEQWSNPIIVVNDGSDSSCDSIFETLANEQVIVLRHELNRGKGEALKTAFTYFLQHYAQDYVGVVTADADGQHTPHDIIRIGRALMESPADLCLGVRDFERQTIPWRSKFGNKLTRVIFRGLYKADLSDTQTGLRGIPTHLLQQLVNCHTHGYDFELEMLIIAAQYHVTLRQIPIQTIYYNNNESSHFNPVLDSMKIYFVFLRFIAVSLSSAAIDFVVFTVCYMGLQKIFVAMLCARVVSGTYNFKMNQHISFQASNKFIPAAIKYILLTCFIGLSAYVLVRAIHSCGVNVYLSKIMAEFILFIVSFLAQRFLIFNQQGV